jgi:hypothetical protein
LTYEQFVKVKLRRLSPPTQKVKKKGCTDELTYIPTEDGNTRFENSNYYLRPIDS